MDFEGRKELFRVLVGSHNYNLNTETSDKDYKLFVAPTFNDLYFNNQFSKSYIGETEDYDVHDIRKISSLWWKSNVNFLEVLFSKKFLIPDNIDIKTKFLITEIYNMRNEIVKMNLPYLYNACIGMHINKKKQVDKGTQGTQHLVNKYGYDTKQAMHSIRILDFLIRFANNNFTDFKKAIWYEKDECNRKWLLNIKNGVYSKSDFESMAEYMLSIAKEHEEKYKTQKPNEKTNQFLLKIVKEIVRNELD
ncbi:DNA polymerase beta superfamily protein [Clostridium haemolyticum]|uniref:DNA polymerase beta superfamily protein n=1 Tax=Clostridium haemolyticum TaxID=84025 RepID=UPI00052D93FF|nr:nucleotidyltransferase domain-containing protein [Clostridium haemolyticum]KGN04183.1 hypothetical protein Z961_04330 [Clostridium haemolyticum NCTC 8350]